MNKNVTHKVTKEKRLLESVVRHNKAKQQLEIRFIFCKHEGQFLIYLHDDVYFFSISEMKRLSQKKVSETQEELNRQVENKAGGYWDELEKILNAANYELAES
jgi:hypothetical protein